MNGIEGTLRRIDSALFPLPDREWDAVRMALLSVCETVLDVGCGNHGRLLRLVPEIPFSVGVDIELPEPGSDDDLHSEYRLLDIRNLKDAFPAQSFDGVVALDVIEHVSKTEGLLLLDAMERIARKKVVVFTPNGYLEQPPSPTNPFQEHLSGWSVDEFLRRGYTVTGFNGWKPLRGMYAELRWRPKRLWWRVSSATQRLVRSRPTLAFQLVCIRDIGS